MSSMMTSSAHQRATSDRARFSIQAYESLQHELKLYLIV